MNLSRVTLAALGAAVVIAGLLGIVGRGCDRTRDGAIRKADEAKGEALGHAGQAQEADKKAAANTADLGALKVQVQRSVAKLAAERAKAHPPASISIPALPEARPSIDGVPVPELVGLASDEVIRAQAAYITRLEDQVSTLTTARNQWKAAYEAETRRSAALEVAVKAQRSSGAVASWKWGLAGVALGFVGGHR